MDDVDLGVVGDGFESDVRHALQHEALADVGMERAVFGRAAGEFGFLCRTVLAVAEQVGGKARGHEARAGEGQGDAGGVGGDPAAPPLLGDEGGGA